MKRAPVRCRICTESTTAVPVLRIPCPICGLRDHTEFVYQSGASPDKRRPAENDTDIDHWCEYVFLPTNPRGAHREYWLHAMGCRQWLIVERDTLTHEITGAVLARHAPVTTRAHAP